MKDLLFVVTFDEGNNHNQHIGTWLVGSAVEPNILDRLSLGIFEVE